MQDQNQIRKRKLNRLRGYNYSRDGWYFITICTKNRIEYLGKIKNAEMQYSQYGDIILKFWQAIPEHYENAFLGQWIIMPNHIHGIIVIQNLIDDINMVGTKHCFVPTDETNKIRIPFAAGENHYSAQKTTEQCSVPMTKTNNKNYGLLSKIVKSFKEISLKTIRKNYNDYEFAWQRSFYDHIIRNEESLDKIRRYIYYNPVKWELDRNNPENLWM